MQNLQLPVILTVASFFQVITGEDWNVVMYDGMQVYNARSPQGIFVAFVYFFTLVIFGNCILSD